MQALASLLEPLKDPGPLFFALLIGHVLADYPLQTEFMAIGKNHRRARPLPGSLAETRGVWVHCLTAHALVHAGAVWMITGSMTLALIEAGLHWGIDFAKSAGLTNLHVDQTLHILCKVGYVWAIHAGWVMAGG
ncbi:MAG: Protein of unknown function DUF3307 [Verrucomicrobia bacterium]|jgi:hypothetical protein|nr:MAG: Protein of unknown function DUF3307 [Verrucomicrobiota bacterium]